MRTKLFGKGSLHFLSEVLSTVSHEILPYFRLKNTRMRTKLFGKGSLHFLSEVLSTVRLLVMTIDVDSTSFFEHFHPHKVLECGLNFIHIIGYSK